jgi:hypothetical protein
MGAKAFRYQAPSRVPRPATYWRRRFLALVLGFGVLSLIAWAFSGALAVGRTAAARSGSSASAARGPGPAGSGPAGSAPQARAGQQNHGASSPAGIQASSPPPAAKPAAPRPPACSASGVVLSLLSSRASYRPGQRPVFDIQVVSTSGRPCTFNVGRKYLMLVITSGDARVWSSADCISGRGSQLASLVRGVPKVLPISWHRVTSTPGCTQRSRRVPRGSYDATASDGGLLSQQKSFRIS